jgi:hypothetical protein
MTTTLPLVFAVQFLAEHWVAVARDAEVHGRGFVRTQLDVDAFTRLPHVEAPAIAGEPGHE